jgi:hypothetical protein
MTNVATSTSDAIVMPRQTQAGKAAAGAGTTQWNDLFIRANLSSPPGQVPVTGDLSNCPDIIPVRNPVQDPQATYSTDASYSQNYSNQVAQGAPTYIYVRAKNLGAAAEGGTVNLYAVGNSLINWPSQWLPNPLSTDGNPPSTTVTLPSTAVGNVVVTPQPFYWVPGSPPPGSDHYCLFALLDTPNKPNPLLHGTLPSTFQTMAQLITSYPNIGWKNVAEVSADAPTWTQSQTIMVPPGQTPGARLHIFVFGSPGLVGGQVAFSSGDTVGFTPINLNQTTLASATDTYGVYTVPSAGQSSATIHLSFWKKDSNPTLQDQISIGVGWMTPSLSDAQPFIDAGVVRVHPAESDDDDVVYEVPIGGMYYSFTAQ